MVKQGRREQLALPGAAAPAVSIRAEQSRHRHLTPTQLRERAQPGSEGERDNGTTKRCGQGLYNPSHGHFIHMPHHVTEGNVNDTRGFPQTKNVDDADFPILVVLHRLPDATEWALPLTHSLAGFSVIGAAPATRWGAERPQRH